MVAQFQKPCRHNFPASELWGGYVRWFLWLSESNIHTHFKQQLARCVVTPPLSVAVWNSYNHDGKGLSDQLTISFSVLSIIVKRLRHSVSSPSLLMTQHPQCTLFPNPLLLSLCSMTEMEHLQLVCDGLRLNILFWCWCIIVAAASNDGQLISLEK